MVLPTIPDSIYKLLVLLGLALGLYGFITQKSDFDNYHKLYIEYGSDLRNLIYEQNELESELKEIYKEAEYYSNKSKIQNPLKISDSGYVFSRYFLGENKVIAISDTIKKLLDTYNAKKKNLKKRVQIQISRDFN